jgi:hypothetical protein
MGVAACGKKPMTETQKGVSPQSRAVESMAKENKKRLPVAGMRLASNTRRTYQDLPPASLGDFLSSAPECVKGILPGCGAWMKDTGSWVKAQLAIVPLN